MTERKKSITAYLLLAAVLALVILYSKQIFALINMIWDITLPLTGGCILAYVLNLIMIRLEKVFFPDSRMPFINKIRPVVCITLSVVLVLLVLMLVLNLVIPELIKAITIFSTNIPMNIQQILKDLESIDRYPYIEAVIEQILSGGGDVREQVIRFATRGISGILTSATVVVGSVGNAVFSFFVTFSFAIYILGGKKKLLNQAQMLGQVFIPGKWLKLIGIFCETANETFASFIVGQVTEAVILGTLCMLGMHLFKIPYATAVGVFVGVTALIPVFGAWIGAGIGALLILAADPVKAFFFLLFIMVLQQLENNLIYPRVVGTSIGLPGIWVLAAITVGAGIGGIAGMFISVPLAATAYKLLRMYVKSKLKHRK